ncbi:GNAT family N-acetyltransferase [Macrococcus hajekii]|uniref:GNAT family N-acetyltransferase n=1 Tax=Macrococcus hajekii TaxID=198482 RepID=A0A4R6BJJ0_9STAP|nr:GNAT family N-acetyltransferase [Macrococcus hajekii]TDM01790.1 GNAT family N-acetyltransferase [Macrococcus hajekii]GGB07499.1 acetyltransferase [Macrococcus hajekii]
MKLIRANVDDTEQIWKMQLESFQSLLDEYQDYHTSPANENIELVRRRLEQPFTYYYFVSEEETIVGAVRVVDKKGGERKRISPIFILPQYRGRGIAQKAIKVAEQLHGSEHWFLETILEEAGNCYLYEKMGYVRNGEERRVNDKMTLVDYIKG